MEQYTNRNRIYVKLSFYFLILKNKLKSLRFNKEFSNIINKNKIYWTKMVKVEFLGPIAKKAVTLDIKSLQELADFMDNDKDLKEWSAMSAVAVNDTIVKESDYPLKDGDRVSILPPVCGG